MGMRSDNDGDECVGGGGGGGGVEDRSRASWITSGQFSLRQVVVQLLHYSIRGS